MAMAADALLPFSVHARGAPARLGRGRIICVGDAAHAMEPNLGQGGCQGIEDAIALGAVARRAPPEKVLRAFEALRLSRIRQVVRQSRLGAMAVHGATLRRFWGARR
jgi:2-polyprenyl-6-methoxyphenol hydroxylase-like FAD-dependent oxidoreductase